MPRVKFTARLRYGTTDRVLAEFTADFEEGQIAECATMLQLLRPAGIEVNGELIHADAPLVVSKETS